MGEPAATLPTSGMPAGCCSVKGLQTGAPVGGEEYEFELELLR